MKAALEKKACDQVCEMENRWIPHQEICGSVYLIAVCVLGCSLPTWSLLWESQTASGLLLRAIHFIAEKLHFPDSLADYISHLHKGPHPIFLCKRFGHLHMWVAKMPPRHE